MEGTGRQGRRGRRRKQLLGDLTVTRRCWKLKEESLDLLSRELAFEAAVGLS